MWGSFVSELGKCGGVLCRSWAKVGEFCVAVGQMGLIWPTPVTNLPHFCQLRHVCPTPAQNSPTFVQLRQKTTPHLANCDTGKSGLCQECQIGLYPVMPLIYTRFFVVPPSQPKEYLLETQETSMLVRYSRFKLSILFNYSRSPNLFGDGFIYARSLRVYGVSGICSLWEAQHISDQAIANCSILRNALLVERLVYCSSVFHGFSFVLV